MLRYSFNLQSGVVSEYFRFAGVDFFLHIWVSPKGNETFLCKRISLIKLCAADNTDSVVSTSNIPKTKRFSTCSWFKLQFEFF